LSLTKSNFKNKLKGLVYFTFYQTKLFDLALNILARKIKKFPYIVLLYHRIVSKESTYLSKGPVVQHELKHFENEIKYLKRNYNLVSIDEVVSRMREGLLSDKPSLSISFDDGYLDNYQFAYPILKRYGVPATIYIATSLIGTTERTWTDQIEFAIMETKKEEFELLELFGGETVEIKTKKQKLQANIRIAEAMKFMPDQNRQGLMGRLFQVLNVEKKAITNGKSRRMLNWEEVKEMAQEGITIGSHGHSHSILSRMQIHRAKEDILTSKKIMEEKLGTKVKHFSFPNGREEDFSEELRDYCQEIGFESVASVIYGMNDQSNGNTYALKRIGAISPVWMLAGELVRLLMRTN
jgi:peptidoglycan/xylan/chitin deacetylase (PgdA/CDA1 family)